MYQSFRISHYVITFPFDYVNISGLKSKPQISQNVFDCIL